MVPEQVVKSKKPQIYEKNGRFLPPEGRFLRNSKKRPCTNLSFDPKKLYTKFHKNLLISFDVIVRTDGRTDRTDLIGPPEKISGDQLLVLVYLFNFVIKF